MTPPFQRSEDCANRQERFLPTNRVLQVIGWAMARCLRAGWIYLGAIGLGGGNPLIYLYTWLTILVISFPIAVVYLSAIKHGRSTRTTGPFFFSYVALLALAFFWIAGVRGVSLLKGLLLVVAFSILVFYVYTEVLDVGFGLRKK